MIEARQQLSQLDREHDLPSMATTILQAANTLTGHREWWREATEPSVRATRACRKKVPGKPGLPFTLKALVRGLACAATARWIPAVQNIIAHLPAEESQPAADKALQVLYDYFATMGRLYTLVQDRTAEYARWECGFGAVDLAIVEAVGMVTYADSLATQMVGEGVGVGLLRRRVAEAETTVVSALADLADRRFEVLQLDAWQYYKAEMAEFASNDGGMHPDLEAVYHVRGSRFTGY